MALLAKTLTYDYGWDDVDQKGDDCDYIPILSNVHFGSIYISQS